MRTAMCGRTGALTNASAKRKGCVNYFYYIVAFIVPFCVYSNSVYGGLVFDDHEAIETNIDVRCTTNYYKINCHPIKVHIPVTITCKSCIVYW